MAEYKLNLKLSEEDVKQLQLGDVVYLTGTVFTSRDMAHLRIRELLEEGKPLPVDFEGGAIFHAGPVAKKKEDGWELSVIGPTTSIRMEPHADMVGKLGVKAIIGKGGMADESLRCFETYRQVYLQAPPGCAVKLGAAVKRIKDVTWLELGMPEALWQLEVEAFGPLVVTMDCHGNSIYRNLKKEAYDTLERVMGR